MIERRRPDPGPHRPLPFRQDDRPLVISLRPAQHRKHRRFATARMSDRATNSPCAIFKLKSLTITRALRGRINLRQLRKLEIIAHTKNGLTQRRKGGSRRSKVEGRRLGGAAGFRFRLSSFDSFFSLFAPLAPLRDAFLIPPPRFRASARTGGAVFFCAFRVRGSEGLRQ